MRVFTNQHFQDLAMAFPAPFRRASAAPIDSAVVGTPPAVSLPLLRGVPHRRCGLYDLRQKWDTGKMEESKNSSLSICVYKIIYIYMYL